MTSQQRIALPPPRTTSFGLVRAAPFQGDATLPPRSEVVIIGGGICGAITAWHLAKRGVPVLLCEKAEIACESSSRAFGWVSELLVDRAKMPLTRESKILWPTIQADAGETGYRQHGLAYLAGSQDDLDFYQMWLESVAGAADPSTCILSPAQVAERYPTARRRFAGALFAPSDGAVEPIIATTSIAEAARRAGARIVTACAVRGLDLQAARVAGVFTEKGYVHTATVLCAANVWSRLFCGNHGVEVPQIYVIMSMGRSGVTDGPIGGGGQIGWAWGQQIDGTYALGGLKDLRTPVTRDALKLYHLFKPLMKAEMGGARLSFGREAWKDLYRRRRWDPSGVSPFERHRILCGEPASGFGTNSLKLNAEVFSEMGTTSVLETWAGAVPLTPDNMPIAGAIESIPGFHLLTGAAYGMTWAPSLGKMMADIMTGVPTSIDPTPFRLSRFFDGSDIQVTH